MCLHTYRVHTTPTRYTFTTREIWQYDDIITHTLGGISKAIFSKTKAARTTKGWLWEFSSRYAPIDVSLGVCTLPIVENMSVIAHPRGCVRYLIICLILLLL